LKLQVGRYSISIYPENEVEEAYIEEVLGLKENGDSVKLFRENVVGMGLVHCLTTRTEEQEEYMEEVV